MKKDLVLSILKNHLDKNKAEAASNAIVDGLGISDEIKRVYKLIDEEETRHKAAMDTHLKKIKEIRKKCGHWSETYHPDPSGNNDSCYSCDICGRER